MAWHVQLARQGDFTSSAHYGEVTAAVRCLIYKRQAMVQQTITFTKHGAKHRSKDVQTGEGHCSMCKLQGIAVMMAIAHHLLASAGIDW